MKTDPAKLREWQQRSRKRLPRESAKRKAERAKHPEIREAVFQRDGGCMLAWLKRDHVCSGARMTPHHLRKASAQKGGYTEENLVTLCAGANSYVEDFPDEAHALGLVIRSGEPSTMPLLLRQLAALRNAF